MKFSTLRLAIAGLFTASASFHAAAIELYVDTKTKQIYAEPGPHRQRLGRFEQVDESKEKASAPLAAPQVIEHNTRDNKLIAQQESEIQAIRQDLELKANEIKALEEHIAANREDKAKNDEKWFNKINIRGYTQLRYNQTFAGAHDGDRNKLTSVGDGGIGDNKSFSFRRVRLVFSGDINEYLSLYIQPDFASNIDSSLDNQNFGQLRDAYADIHFDKAHEYRIRAGQSKVPFGWENLQSSQNRLTLDRADALNSAVPSERDLGLFAYYTPEHVQKLWKTLSKKGLKTSGDYGVLGFGIYNGQGLNRNERNDDLYLVAHATYPIELGFLGYRLNGQVLEVGADAISGHFSTSVGTLSSGRFSGLTPTLSDKNQMNSEDRVAVHAILFPQPFGLQAEWNWGKGATLDTSNLTINRQSLNGGYVQAMYKIDNVFGTQGTLIPYAKWQTYEGAWKGVTNAPRINTNEIEAGIEWQIMKALEVTLAYSYMDRTNVRDLEQYQAELIRAQLQWNY